MAEGRDGKNPHGTLPERGKVEQVCKQWLVHEDGVMAYKMQGEENDFHFGLNRRNRRTIRDDIPVVKVIQNEEEVRQQEERMTQLKALSVQAEEDEKLAKLVLTDLQLEESMQSEHRELKDEEMARVMQQKEKRKYDRYIEKKRDRQLQREREKLEKRLQQHSEEARLTLGSTGSEQMGDNSHGTSNLQNTPSPRENGVSRVTPSGRIEDDGDFSDFFIQPPEHVDENQKRQIQEFQDEELAKLLQEQEHKRTKAEVDRGKLREIEHNDEQLARIIQEQERIKLQKKRQRRHPSGEDARRRTKQQNGESELMPEGYQGGMPGRPGHSGDAMHGRVGSVDEGRLHGRMGSTDEGRQGRMLGRMDDGRPYGRSGSMDGSYQHRDVSIRSENSSGSRGQKHTPTEPDIPPWTGRIPTTEELLSRGRPKKSPREEQPPGLPPRGPPKLAPHIQSSNRGRPPIIDDLPVSDVPHIEQWLSGSTPTSPENNPVVWAQRGDEGVQRKVQSKHANSGQSELGNTNPLRRGISEQTASPRTQAKMDHQQKTNTQPRRSNSEQASLSREHHGGSGRDRARHGVAEHPAMVNPPEQWTLGSRSPPDDNHALPSPSPPGSYHSDQDHEFNYSGSPDMAPQPYHGAINPVEFNIATAIDPTYRRRQQEIDNMDETERKQPAILSAVPITDDADLEWDPSLRGSLRRPKAHWNPMTLPPQEGTMRRDDSFSEQEEPGPLSYAPVQGQKRSTLEKSRKPKKPGSKRSSCKQQ